MLIGIKAKRERVREMGKFSPFYDLYFLPINDIDIVTIVISTGMTLELWLR